MIAAERNTKSPAFQIYVGDFMSSPDVMLMTAQEVGAYWLLLCTAWQSEPQGYLENDEDRLRRIGRLNPKQWAESRTLLLKKFVETPDRNYRFNPRMIRELEKQLSRRQQMRENGAQPEHPGKLPRGRPKKLNPKVSEEKQKVFSEKASEAAPENQTKTTSSSSSFSSSFSTAKEEKAPSFPHGQEDQEMILTPPPVKKRSDDRTGPFTEALKNYYEQVGNCALEWDLPERSQLKKLLDANPSLTLGAFESILRHRAESTDVVHTQRASRWLPYATSYLAGPLNKFHQPLLSGGTNGTTSSRFNQQVASSRTAADLLSKQNFATPHSRGDFEERAALGSGVEGALGEPLDSHF